MSNKDYLYARSSSYKQNIETQVKTLDYLHIPEENIIKDKGITGKKLGSNRKGFKNLIAKLTPDDNVHVTSIDRLGRLPNVLENAIQIIQNTGANIITHSETDINILENNTITPETDITSLPLQELINNIHYDYLKIRERCANGFNQARKEGRIKGRPSKNLSPEDKKTLDLVKNKKLTVKEAESILPIKKSSIYNYLKNN